jgi:hypothetical protein
MEPNKHFTQGVDEAMQEAQRRANEEGRSIKVGELWVNPSSASLARRPKPDDGIPKVFDNYSSKPRPTSSQQL